MTSRRAIVVALLVAFALAAPVNGRDPHAARRRAHGRLLAESGAGARVRFDPATGAARFVAAAPGKRIGLAKPAPRATGVPAKRERVAEFFCEYGALFGVASAAAQLEEVRLDEDREGGTHLVYRQRHRGLPVFAGE